MHIVRAEVLCGEEFLPREVINVCGADLMSDVLAFAKTHTVLVTGLTNAQVIRTAEMIDAIGIVFVRGKKPPQEVVELAKDNGMPLLTTELLMYDVCGMIYQQHQKAKGGSGHE